MIGVTIDNVGKRFGDVTALDGISLTLEPGEIFFLLGPSGCGKTTLLRCIAGFYIPDAGTIRFGTEDVTRLPAHLRKTGMVFQNYALWPHKTVAENVAFGLEEQRVGRDEIKRRVAEALASVRMENYAARGIHQLSGGQQQRVALARALVVRPRCLLLDEPLSNLDAKLRLEMRTEIRRICKEAGLTAIYVTHDQKEALSIADRLAVLDAGRVRQVGAPGDVYRNPVSRFVADFIGETNFLEAKVESVTPSSELVASVGRCRFRSTTASALSGNFRVGDRVTLSIRPEAWCISELRDDSASDSETNSLTGKITESIYLGEMAQYSVAISGLSNAGDGNAAVSLKVYELNPRLIAPGGLCRVSVTPDEVVVLPG